MGLAPAAEPRAGQNLDDSIGPAREFGALGFGSRGGSSLDNDISPRLARSRWTWSRTRTRTCTKRNADRLNLERSLHCNSGREFGLFLASEVLPAFECKSSRDYAPESQRARARPKLVAGRSSRRDQRSKESRPLNNQTPFSFCPGDSYCSCRARRLVNGYMCPNFAAAAHRSSLQPLKWRHTEPADPPTSRPACSGWRPSEVGPVSLPAVTVGSEARPTGAGSVRGSVRGSSGRARDGPANEKSGHVNGISHSDNNNDNNISVIQQTQIDTTRTTTSGHCCHFNRAPSETQTQTTVIRERPAESGDSRRRSPAFEWPTTRFDCEQSACRNSRGTAADIHECFWRKARQRKSIWAPISNAQNKGHINQTIAGTPRRAVKWLGLGDTLTRSPDDDHGPPMANECQPSTCVPEENKTTPKIPLQDALATRDKGQGFIQCQGDQTNSSKRRTTPRVQQQQQRRGCKLLENNVIVYNTLFLLMVIMTIINDFGLPRSATFFRSIGLESGALNRKPFASADAKTISIKIGALFEETDFEQSNVFVRTIKMINEGKSEAIRQLLAGQQQQARAASAATSPIKKQAAAPFAASPSPSATKSEINSRNLPTSPSLPLAAPGSGALFNADQMGQPGALLSASENLDHLQQQHLELQLELDREEEQTNAEQLNANAERDQWAQTGPVQSANIEIHKRGARIRTGRGLHDDDEESAAAAAYLSGGRPITRRTPTPVRERRALHASGDRAEAAAGAGRPLGGERKLGRQLATSGDQNSDIPAPLYGPSFAATAAGGSSDFGRVTRQSSESNGQRRQRGDIDERRAGELLGGPNERARANPLNGNGSRAANKVAAADIKSGPEEEAEQERESGRGLIRAARGVHSAARPNGSGPIQAAEYITTRGLGLELIEGKEGEPLAYERDSSWSLIEPGPAPAPLQASRQRDSDALGRNSARDDGRQKGPATSSLSLDKSAPSNLGAAAAAGQTRPNVEVDKQSERVGIKLDQAAGDGDNNNQEQQHQHQHLQHHEVDAQGGAGARVASARLRREALAGEPENDSLTNGFSIWNPFASFSGGGQTQTSGESDGHASSPSALQMSSGSSSLEGERERDATAKETTASGQEAPLGTRVKFEPMVEFMSNRDSSFEADKRVCQLIESGVRTLVGPLEGLSIQHVQSICDNMELPYFQLRPLLGSMASSAAGAGHAFLPASSRNSREQTSSANNEDNGSKQLLQRDQFVRQRDFNVARRNDSAVEEANLDQLGPSSDLSEDSETEFGPGEFVERRKNHDQQSDNDLSIVVASSSGSPENNQTTRDFLFEQEPDQLKNKKLNVNYQATQSLNGPSAVDDLLTLNLHPPAHLLTSAYIDLIYAWNWSSFAIVYEDDSSMIKLQDLFRESSGTWTSRWKIRLFRYRQQARAGLQEEQFDEALRQQQHDHLVLGSDMLAKAPDSKAGEVDAVAQAHDQQQQHQHQAATRAPDPVEQQSETFRDLFWRIKRTGEQNIILDLSGQNLNEALKQAQQVGCMTDRFNYLITSLDLHVADLENFKYGRTRITALSLISLDPYLARDTRNHLAEEQYLEQLGLQILARPSSVQSRNRNTANFGANQGHASQSHSSSSSHSFRSSKFPKFRLSPSIVLDKTGTYIDPPTDSFVNGASIPGAASSGGPRSNHADMGGQGFGPGASGPVHHTSGFQVARSQAEDELFHLLINNQIEMLNLSRVRLATTSAILHDSLILLALGLHELDPNGNYMTSSTPPSSSSSESQGDLELTMAPASEQQQQAPINAEPIQLSCSNPDSRPWRYGSSLINYMRRLSFTGLTGPIRFDRLGLRSSFKLNVLGMANEIGLVKVGEWHSDLHNRSSVMQLDQLAPSLAAPPGVELGDQDNQELSDVERELARVKQRLASIQQEQENGGAAAAGDLKDVMPFKIPYKLSLSRSGALKVNKVIFERLYKEQTDQIDTLIVTTKLSQPYFMLKETPSKLEGNDQYEGFAVDLIHELSRLLNFRYRWREAADKKYGARETLANGTVVWNGMIGEIVRGEADLAIVDLTITSQREEAVDFTLPFMNTGISILFKKPTTKVTTLYSFLSPFTRDVWGYVLAAYCGISAILFFVGHLSPYEWADPHPCPHLKGEDSILEAMLQNQFSLPNSFWFTIGSLMQQGSDLTPRSMSTRTIAGIWYFFTLIMISSYTANLAAFLTVEKVIYPIENVRDLANQQEIRYGCVESGSTCTFFKDSQIPTYMRINETMHKFKSYLKSNEDGQKKVEEGKFAFFMESASIEYIVERNCNLTQIGGLLDSKGYGLATSKKSRLKRPYRTLLSEGILHLQETGMLQVLKNRWWKERRGGGTCADDGKGGGVTELSLANVGGVFVVLVGGLCLAFSVAMGEFLWRSQRNGMSRNNLCDHMMNDLKFALNCTKSVKTVSLQEKLAKRQRSLIRMSSSQRSRSQSESQSQLNTISAPILSQPFSTSQSQLVMNNRRNYNEDAADLSYHDNQASCQQHAKQPGNNHYHYSTTNSEEALLWSGKQQFASSASKNNGNLNWQQPPPAAGLKNRKQIVGFSTSDEVEGPWTSPDKYPVNLTQMLEKQHRQRDQFKQQQQQQLCNRPKSVSSSISNRHHQSTQNKPNQPALAQLRHSNSLQQQPYYAGQHQQLQQQQQQQAALRQQRPHQSGGLADPTINQRRQLFAQQTVDTIDDELVWQPN